MNGNKLGADITNDNVLSVQMDGEQKSQFYIFSTHIRRQVAKMSDVKADITNGKTVSVQMDAERKSVFV